MDNIKFEESKREIARRALIIGEKFQSKTYLKMRAEEIKEDVEWIIEPLSN